MKVYVLFHTDREDSYSTVDGVFTSFEKALEHKKKDWSEWNQESKWKNSQRWDYQHDRHPAERGSGFVVSIEEKVLDDSK